MPKKADELINRLSKDSSDANVVLAIDWLSKQNNLTNDSVRLIELLINERPGSETLKWINEWVQDKSWSLLSRFAYARSARLFYWLIELLESNPSHPDAGKLWHDLLMDYDDRLAVDGADRWLIEHQNDPCSQVVVRKLLEYAPREEIVRIARDFSRQFPDDVMLLSNLIRLGDEHSSQLGVQLLRKLDRVQSSLIAEALLHLDSPEYERHVRDWLNEFWNHRTMPELLWQMLIDGSESTLCISLDWMTDHPRAKKNRLVEDFILFDPTKHKIEMIWDWLKERPKDKQMPDMVKRLLAYSGDVPMPSELLSYAESWASANVHDGASADVIVGLLQSEATKERIELASRWIASHAEEEHGGVLAALVRATGLNEYVERGRSWLKQFWRNHIDTPSLANAMLEKQPTMEMVSFIEGVARDAGTSAKKLVFLTRIKLGDPEAVAEGQSQIERRIPSWKYIPCSSHAYARVLTALLSAVPADDALIERARHILASGDTCAEHMEPLREQLNVCLAPSRVFDSKQCKLT